MSYFDIKQVRSRNWEIEEEEEEQTQIIYKPQPQLKLTTNNNIDCKLLIIATKDAPSLYIRANFQNLLVEIGEITISDIHPINTNEVILNNRCLIYRYSKDESIVFVLCQCLIPEDRSFNTANLIIDTFKPKDKVIIIDSLVDTQYVSSNHVHPQPPFLRTLSTSDYTNNDSNRNSFTPLESPNLVQGLTAALLSKCQVESIKAISLQNLVESSELSITSVINLEKQLLQIDPIFKLEKRASNQDYLKSIHSINCRDDRGLYI